MTKSIITIILILLSSFLYAENSIEILSPKDGATLGDFVCVKVKQITNDTSIIPKLFVIESNEDVSNPEHPPVEWTEITECHKEKETKIGKDTEIIWDFIWDTVHIPSPTYEYLTNSHNGKHTLKAEFSNISKNIDVNLKNLTLQCTPETLFAFNVINQSKNYNDLTPEVFESLIDNPTLIPTPQEILIKIDDNDTNVPYNVTVHIYHMETPFSGLMNKKGQNINKPIQTFNLENCTGDTQKIIWKGESNFTKTILEQEKKALELHEKKINEINEKIEQKKKELNLPENDNLPPEEVEKIYTEIHSKYREPALLYPTPDNPKSLIPGVEYNKEPINQETKTKNIKISQDILNSNIFNTPEYLYDYAESFNLGSWIDADGNFIKSYNYDFNEIDWTEKSQKYNFSSEIITNDSYSGCNHGVYEIDVIVSQNIEYKYGENIYGTTDTNHVKSDYLTSLRAIKDNGSIIYNMSFEDEYGELIDAQRIQEEKIENFEAEIEKETEELAKQNISEEEIEKILIEKYAETFKQLEKNEEDLENNVNHLFHYYVYEHHYRLVDKLNKNASLYKTKFYCYDYNSNELYELPVEKQEFKCTHNCEKGINASKEGINHTVISHINVEQETSDLIYDTAKDSHGFLYRDHENRWAL